MQNNDEAELIARSLDGDHKAYAELVDRYKDAVFYHCFAIVRDEAVAEDIAQETFITAYYKLGRYDSKYRLATWLFSIGTNRALTHLRKKKKQAPEGDDLLVSVASTHPTPQQDMVDSELHAAVDRLRPTYRTAISLYYWQGLDYAEVATVMDAPINSVRVWLKRAKDELRKELS